MPGEKKKKDMEGDKKYTPQKTISNIERIKKEMEIDFLEKLNREGDNNSKISPRLQKTVLGLKLVREESKNPTQVEKTIEELRRRTSEKPF